MDLFCTVSGEPEPVVRWEVDGKELKKSKEILIESSKDGTHHLQIKSATLENSGAYKCIADSNAGTVETEAKVTVEGKFLAVLVSTLSVGVTSMI